MKGSYETLQDKWKEEEKSLKFVIIKNKDLVCKDCAFRYDDEVREGNTSRCNKYDIKPGKVLSGGKCEKYQEEVK